MQDRRDAGQEGYSTGRMQYRKDAVQGGCSTGAIQDMCDTGKEGCWKREMQERRDAERRDAERRDAGRRESGLEGIRNGGIWDWRYTRNEGYIRGFRTREMLDRRNTGQLVCRKGGYSTGGTGQEGCRMRGMQDRWDAGQDGNMTGGVQERKDG